MHVPVRSGGCAADFTHRVPPAETPGSPEEKMWVRRKKTLAGQRQVFAGWSAIQGAAWRGLRNCAERGA